jgi:hypothetical protein
VSITGTGFLSGATVTLSGTAACLFRKRHVLTFACDDGWVVVRAEQRVVPQGRC